MLRTHELVLQVRHFPFCAIEHAAQIIANAQVDAGASHSRPAFQFRAQAAAQSIYGHAEFLEQWPRHPFGLIEQREEKMFVRDLLLIEFRGDVLRSLERLLHFLREFIYSHTATLEGAAASANRGLRPDFGFAVRWLALGRVFLPRHLRSKKENQRKTAHKQN